MIAAANTRKARKAIQRGRLLSTSNADEVYEMPDGEIVVVMLTAVARRVTRKRGTL